MMNKKAIKKFLKSNEAWLFIPFIIVNTLILIAVLLKTTKL